MQLYARLHGAEKSTFFGLAGIGDIMLTCKLIILIIAKKRLVRLVGTGSLG